jgi:DNA repair protein RadC
VQRSALIVVHNHPMRRSPAQPAGYPLTREIIGATRHLKVRCTRHSSSAFSRPQQHAVDWFLI